MAYVYPLVRVAPNVRGGVQRLASSIPALAVFRSSAVIRPINSRFSLLASERKSGDFLQDALELWRRHEALSSMRPNRELLDRRQLRMLPDKRPNREKDQPDGTEIGEGIADPAVDGDDTLRRNGGHHNPAAVAIVLPA